MANKRRSKKKEPANVPLLLLILALCVVVIVVIVTVTDRNGGSDDTDPVSDIVADGTDDVETDQKDETTGTDKTYEDTSDSVEDTETDNVTETETEPEDTDGQTSSDDGYTVDTEVETQKTDNGDVTIVYPTIKDPENNDETTELLNKLIKDYMDQKFKYDGVTDTGSEYTYEITDTVTTILTDEFASIIIKGRYYISDTPNPTVFAYTINCDIKASAIISASDLVYDFGDVRNLFLNGKFTLTEGMEGLLEETNYEDMIMEYRAEYGVYPNVYFTESGFGMVIDLVYTLGGYALFEIPYSSVEDVVFCPVN